MIYDPKIHQDYIKDILPFTRNGIIIDTSVIKELLDGFISLRFSNFKKESYEQLLNFLDRIKVNNQWNKFLITPHILTEVCNHLNRDYRKNHNYNKIITEILPILDGMKEKIIDKDRILDSIEIKDPSLEIGDISIFLTTQEILNKPKKIAILVKDSRFYKEYKNNQEVFIFDYDKTIWNIT